MTMLVYLAALIAVCGAVALSPVGIFAGQRVTSATPSPALPNLSREEYFDERRLLLEARQRSHQAAEQMVTGGATGALLLSITFLEKFAPAATAKRPGILIIAWLFLLCTLGVSLLGQHYAAQAFDWEIRRMEVHLGGGIPPENIWQPLQHACGVAGRLLFISGVALLAWFAYINAPFQIGR
jgi:hypothetical protein